MKASDYLDKWYEKLIHAGDKDSEVLAAIITDFGKELIEIKEQRKATKTHAIFSLMTEQSKKYNKFCRLVNEKLGIHYLHEDGLKKYWISKNPVIGEWWQKGASHE